MGQLRRNHVLSEYIFSSLVSVRVGRVVRWCWVNFQCRGVLLIWIRVGQGPTALALGAGGGCLDIFFSRLSFIFSFSLSLGDGPIKTEILSQRAVKPKTTNQPSFSQYEKHTKNEK